MVGMAIKHFVFLITLLLAWIVYIPTSIADTTDTNTNVFDLSIEELFDTEVTGVSGFSEKIS